MLSFLFNPWVISAGIATIAVVLILLSSFVSIRENQVGVVAKRFSPAGSLPEGRVVALKGEAGFQAATLPPGLHFPYWPWQYRISKYPITAIEQGYIGLVIANDGSPMPVDRVMSNVVDCDFFQDGVKFLSNGGQKGRQTAILTAGYYRINPILFKVIPNVKITSIGSDKVGIVTVLDGAPMPQGEMAAPVIAGHDNYQNPDAFVRNGGCRGLQEQIILAGT
jgi:uncharacterized membrane protein YqiK